jgi:hypothetical protein
VFYLAARPVVICASHIWVGVNGSASSTLPALSQQPADFLFSAEESHRALAVTSLSYSGFTMPYLCQKILATLALGAQRTCSENPGALH